MIYEPPPLNEVWLDNDSDRLGEKQRRKQQRERNVAQQKIIEQQIVDELPAPAPPPRRQTRKPLGPFRTLYQMMEIPAAMSPLLWALLMLLMIIIWAYWKSSQNQREKCGPITQQLILMPQKISNLHHRLHDQSLHHSSHCTTEFAFSAFGATAFIAKCRGYQCGRR